MTILHNAELGIMHRFGPIGSIGRRQGADLQIPHRTCSLRHAEIRWNGERWLLRDLDSRNGTWVNGHVLAQDQQVSLQTGMSLAFGSPPDVWTVESVRPPVACASAPGRSMRFADGGRLQIPTSSGTEILLIEEDEAWWIEQDGVRRACPAEEEVWVDDVPWRIQAPTAAATTTEFTATRSLCDAQLTFRVSLDEERVTIDVLSQGIVTRVDSRSHSYLLLVLARRRLSDREAGIEPEEEGWIHVAEELTALLKAHSPNDLHVQAHRARKQLRDRGFGDPELLFERRPGWVRLGPRDIIVVPDAPEEESTG